MVTELGRHRRGAEAGNVAPEEVAAGAEDAADDVLRDFAVPLVGHGLVDEALDEAGDALRGPVVGLIFRHLVNVDGDGEENAAPGGENVGAVWTGPDALKQKVGHDATLVGK